MEKKGWLQRRIEADEEANKKRKKDVSLRL